MTLSTESVPMRLARRLGWERIAWSLRRLHCPVGPKALVLEVGSGGNPYARADVLLDAYEATRERHWVPLIADRPTVLGMGEQLPFRDQSFDFVIASHVLEHTAEPERFLAELQRVARAGYIEVPDALFERLNPYRDHRLEVTERDGQLVIRKKPAPTVDPELAELYEHRAKRHVTQDLFPQHPFAFHVRHFWEGRIRYTVLNPEVDAGWPAPPAAERTVQPAGLRQRVQGALLRMLRAISRALRTRRKLDLLSLTRCPACRHEQLRRSHDKVVCGGCQRRYPVRHGIPCLQTSFAEVA